MEELDAMLEERKRDKATLKAMKNLLKAVKIMRKQIVVIDRHNKTMEAMRVLLEAVKRMGEEITAIDRDNKTQEASRDDTKDTIGGLADDTEDGTQVPAQER